MKRNAYGQMLEPFIDELSAIDDVRLRFWLKKPFPLLFQALATLVIRWFKSAIRLTCHARMVSSA